MNKIKPPSSRLGVVFVALLGLSYAQGFAQGTTQGNTQVIPLPTTEPSGKTVALSAAIPESDAEALQTIPADTSRAILKQFKADNPDAREHKLALVSEAFIEDESNPALKLERMWVGSKSTLLEITGLTRRGQPNSAAIAPDTLRLTNLKTGQAAAFLAAEGVAQVLDRRGGKALLLKTGDTMYLQMEPIDDLQTVSLDYTGWDNRPAKYFDRIDPRFRERYDAAHKLASGPSATPEQMKDFLVEFGKYDPDKKAPQVFIALINKMRAQNTFEGYYQAYLLITDPEDARKASLLARTDEHRSKLEHMAVATLTDKNRLFDFDLRLASASTSSREGRCWMACTYNFTASRPVAGQLSLRLQPTSPIKLKQATYKVVFGAEVRMPRRKIRQSRWLGNYDGPDDISYTREISAIVSPPNYSANVDVQLGSLDVAFFQRGSAGGYEGAYATSNASIQLRLKSVELIK